MSFVLGEIPCDLDNPCLNGGTCSGTMVNYQCTCAEGYTGINCESKDFYFKDIQFHHENIDIYYLQYCDFVGKH